MTFASRPANRALTALLAGVLGFCGCATHPDHADSQPTVASIADELVDVAETRTDLRNVRAYVHEMNELSPAKGRHTTEAIATELEHQLLLALHSRINVVDSDLSKPDAETGQDALQVARFYDATHLLIGEYARDGDDLMLCLRLVDADSKVIVAASEGNIPLLALSDDARASSRTPVWRRPSHVWRGK